MWNTRSTPRYELAVFLPESLAPAVGQDAEEKEDESYEDSEDDRHYVVPHWGGACSL